ncbi:MAG: hypothetical protein LBF27_09440 [Sphingobacterium sp.]|jgi:hypothetical protein|nr:hypothetical protein [Sphingobacterium sp.]
MKGLGLILLVLLLWLNSASYAQTDQESKLVQTFLAFNAGSDDLDTIAKNILSQRFEEQLIHTLEKEDITTFDTFREKLDSLNSAFSLKKSGDYELFTLRFNIEHWNYILKNKEVINKQEKTFDFFYAVYPLDQMHYLLIKRMDEMSFSCYQAYIYKENFGLFTADDPIKDMVTSFLSVYSWTNVSEGSLKRQNILESESTDREGIRSYPAIPIKFNTKTKEISYSFYRQQDGKKITRRARYLNGGFMIKSYDARTFEE